MQYLSKQQVRVYHVTIFVTNDIQNKIIKMLCHIKRYQQFFTKYVIHNYLIIFQFDQLSIQNLLILSQKLNFKKWQYPI